MDFFSGISSSLEVFRMSIYTAYESVRHQKIWGIFGQSLSQIRYSLMMIDGDVVA
jgi:hypothetical protein